MKIIAYMLIFLFSIILLGLGLLGFNYFTSEHPKKEEPNITSRSWKSRWIKSSYQICKFGKQKNIKDWKI